MSDQRTPAPLYRIRPAALFDPLTRFYDFGCSLLGLGPVFKRRILEDADLYPGAKVLDVACGTGVLLGEASAKAAEVKLFGADPDPIALRYAERIAERRLVRSRAEGLPFRSGSFDRVICTLALHHIPDVAKEAAIREMARVLRPDGFLLLVDFDNRGRWWVPEHFRSDRRLEDWFVAAGLRHRLLWRTRMLYTFKVESVE